MSEEDIKRFEKKVDLLYKILLELRIPDFGAPYDQSYINTFMDELIPLFGLSAEKEEIKGLFTQEDISKRGMELQNELKKLKKIYENGDFLAKEEETIKNKIEDLTNKLKELSEISALYNKVRDKNKEIYENGLFIDLQRKVGVSEKNIVSKDIIFQRIEYPIARYGSIDDKHYITIDEIKEALKKIKLK